MASARINLPTTYSDTRATVFRLYRSGDTTPATVITEVPIGTTDFVDAFTFFGANYFYTAVDTVSGAESAASPIARVFRRNSTTPKIF